MAYNEALAERISNIFNRKSVPFYEKKMFGGVAFMVDEKMCVGVVKEELMARVGEDCYPKALAQEGCKEMNFTGRPMKGYVFVQPEGMDTDEQLEQYVQWCLDFNPLAKASKKKPKKAK